MNTDEHYAEHPGVPHQLPASPLKPVRHLGWLLLVSFGIVFPGMAICGAWWVGLLNRWWAMMTLGLLLGSSPVLLIGGWLLCGRTEFEVADSSLIRTLRLGPFRWTTRRPLARLQQLIVVRFGETEWKPTAAISIGFLIIPLPLYAFWSKAPKKADWGAALLAQWQDGACSLVAAGHSGKRLLAFAHQLSAGVTIVDDVTGKETQPAVVCDSFPLDVGESRELLHPPPGSHLQLEAGAGSVTITQPPLGSRQSGTVLLVMAIAFNGLAVLFSLVFVPALIAGKVEGESLVGWLVLGVFWLFALGIGLVAAHVRRRSATLSVAGGALTVVRSGLFGTRRRHWQRDQIESISVRTTNWDDDPSTSLSIQITNGRRQNMLAYLAKPELEWIVAVLRRELNLGG